MMRLQIFVLLQKKITSVIILIICVLERKMTAIFRFHTIVILILPVLCFKKKIEREVVTFNSKPYHRGCFTCHQCRFELSGKPIFSHEGNEFCEKCYGLFHAKRCVVCFEPLTGK